SQPPFSGPFTSKYQVRDMWETGLFNRDENLDRMMRPFTSSTIKGSISPDGHFSVQTITGLPVNPNHPELLKLKRHLSIGSSSEVMYYHGFNGRVERIV